MRGIFEPRYHVEPPWNGASVASARLLRIVKSRLRLAEQRGQVRQAFDISRRVYHIALLNFHLRSSNQERPWLPETIIF